MVKYWKVKLSAGYSGTEEEVYIKSEEKDLEENFEGMVNDHAESYEYVAQLRSVGEIMEEEVVDEDAAEEIADGELEDFYQTARECSSYEECSEEEWKENEGTSW